MKPTQAPPPPAEAVTHLWECLGRWSAYLVNEGRYANLAPPQYMLDAITGAVSCQPGDVQAPTGPRTPDPTMVICPACTSQFVAIPETAQAELARLRAENERLKADAARYRWMRADREWDALHDAAIDAAMAQGDKA